MVAIFWNYARYPTDAKFVTAAAKYTLKRPNGVKIADLSRTACSGRTPDKEE